jgi:hypothetical protein
VEPDLSVFQRKLEERRAREAAEKETERALAAGPPVDRDLIPEDPYVRSDKDKAMDEVIEKIDIIYAYNRWCGKMRPTTRPGQREGIKISCPIPGHVDKDPSAWINLDEQVWFCGGCQVGGDAHDLAAYHFGFPVPGYKEGAAFHELREKMALDFGFTFTALPGGAVEVTPPVAEEHPEEPSTMPAEGVEVVGELDAELMELYDDSDLEVVMPSLDWRPIVPEGTFISQYMQSTIIDDVPEEYHFFHALLALGFALGRDVRLYDLVPVYGNLFICTLGRSGVGKSKARYHLDSLLTQALPHDWSDETSKGVRKISSPGSAEVLIHNFQKPVMDPAEPKKISHYAPVRGMIDFSELSSLMARTNRQGSALTPTLMQFYDMEGIVATSSLTHGAKMAYMPYASALTTTQPRSLRTLVTRADDASGFLNRWVFVPGTEKKRFAVGGARVDMSPAVSPLQEILGWAGSFTSDRFVEWSPEAEKRFTDFFHTTIELDKRKATNDLITRVDLLLKKMILLFAANQHQPVVRIEHVEYAIHCYQYLIDAYSIPGGQIGNTIQTEISEAILNQTRKVHQRGGRPLTMNDISKALKGRKYPLDMLLKTADTLVKLGYLQLETPKPGSVGRPSVRYRYVD